MMTGQENQEDKAKISQQRNKDDDNNEVSVGGVADVDDGGWRVRVGRHLDIDHSTPP